jgi:hypothetical protein
MAYVAISNELINSTQNNIMSMRDKEKTAVTAVAERISVPSKDANLELLVWGNHLHLRDQIPDDWKTATSRVQARINYEWAEGKTSCFDFTFECADPIEVPRCENHSYYGHQVKVDETSHLLPAQAREAIEYNKFLRVTDDKWNDIKTQVSNFLRAAKSLNEALKLWPALSLYVSDKYIDRVNNNPKREKTASRAEEIMASISIDDLTAAAVASKLTV